MANFARIFNTSWRLVTRRLSNRGDTEHEQALIRIAIVGLLLVYASLVPIDHPPGAHWVPTVAQVGYIIGPLSCLHFAWIIWDPAVRYVRRAVWMVIDHAGIVLAMAVGGEPMALLYPLLLWVTLGHGFRYGPRHLIGSALISVCLFAPLVLLHPFWQTKGQFGIGLILGLVLIPGYCYRLLRHLHDARQRAEASSEAKSRFLATMSHELRTPLHAILGMTALLRGTRLGPDQRDMARTIHTAGHGLLNMIEDILDIARIEAGATRNEIERFDVHRLLHEIRDMLGYRAQTQGLALRLHIDADLPAELMGPKRALQQILINLTANAVKFTEQGEVRIEAAITGSTSASAELMIAVIDTGCGIPLSAQARIFESFTQVDETTTRRHGGSGLGLAIVKRLIEASGGSVALTSDADQGTRFDVRLPIVPLGDVAPAAQSLVVVHGEPNSAQLEQIATAGLQAVTAAQIESAFASAQTVDLWCNPAAGSPAITRHGRDLVVWGATAHVPDALVALPPSATTAQLNRAVRAALVIANDVEDADNAAPRVDADETSLDVLVADDHHINQQVIERLLVRGGHRAVVVASGEAALEKVATSAFDVVVLDLNMPGIGGMAVATDLASKAGRPRLIALTADATTATRDACLAQGFDSFLTKPVDAVHLLAALRREPSPEAEVADTPAPTTPASPPPKATAAAAGVLDYRRIDMLRDLDGGDGFVREIIDGFIADGRGLVIEIKEAAVQGDVERFGDAAHALRSAATHLGATALFEECLSAKSVADEHELRAQAAVLGRRLDAAFAAASGALEEARDAEPEPVSARRVS